jgi:hypothetical protein
MRRVLVMSLIGLMLAFGVFYAFSWPSSLEGARGSEAGIDDVKVGELLHVGLADFRVAGRRPIKIVTVKLVRPSAAISLVETRIYLAGNGRPSVGVQRGEDRSVAALPRAPGYVLNDTDSGSFVATFTIDSPGDFSFDGFEVTYQTGWLTRSVTLGTRVTIRAPAPLVVPAPSPSASP